jgi:hypothetical protein
MFLLTYVAACVSASFAVAGVALLLLMPRDSLLKDFKKMAKNGFSESLIGVLAKQYAVSEDAMRIQLINLSSVTS